ncbi:hypothetical protein [Blochmannia endosymbiont of Camponotus (Colobopsis) obliquus]|nr:hypothetical protein [Blochmannia endosymbiont of Camponotus (Colobopsis) obliquus]
MIKICYILGISLLNWVFIIFLVDGYNIPIHKLKSVDIVIVRSVT